MLAWLSLEVPEPLWVLLCRVAQVFSPSIVDDIAPVVDGAFVAGAFAQAGETSAMVRATPIKPIARFFMLAISPESRVSSCYRDEAGDQSESNPCEGRQLRDRKGRPSICTTESVSQTSELSEAWPYSLLIVQETGRSRMSADGNRLVATAIADQRQAAEAGYGFAPLSRQRT
jgi:hypothetical protein